MALQKFNIKLFQVRVRIIEGRQLSGSNISPVVRITVANHTRQTKVKHSTNKPFYDEVSYKLNRVNCINTGFSIRASSRRNSPGTPRLFAAYFD